VPAPSAFEPCELADLDRIVAYLEAAPVLNVAAGVERDVISDALGVPVGAASDGVFTWPLSLTWYAARHRVAPPDELVEHIRARAYTLGDVDIDAVRQDDDGDNGWGAEPG
jgi:hypothetical protein